MVISDVVMSSMDGYHFFQELKKNEATARIPVLIMTTRKKMEDTFYMSNVDGFIVKPFENDVFVAKVKEILGDQGGGADAGGAGAVGAEPDASGPGSPGTF